MLYLFLAILCSAAFAMILKWSALMASSKEYVLFGTYLSATIISALGLLFTKPSTGLTAQGDLKLLLGLSILTGIIHFAAFKLYQLSIYRNGIAITGAFAKMGILIPTLVSMVVWREFPELFQAIGILLTLVALFYYYAPQQDDHKTFRVSYLLLILMIVNGTTDFMTKVFQKSFALIDMNFYLTMTFFTGLFVSLFMAVRKGQFAFKDILIGGLLGFPIVLSFYCLILALNDIIAAIVFPVFSAGSLVAITLTSIIFFKEMPGKKEWITICGILVALVFINL